MITIFLKIGIFPLKIRNIISLMGKYYYDNNHNIIEGWHVSS